MPKDGRCHGGGETLVSLIDTIASESLQGMRAATADAACLHAVVPSNAVWQTTPIRAGSAEARDAAAPQSAVSALRRHSRAPHRVRRCRCKCRHVATRVDGTWDRRTRGARAAGGIATTPSSSDAGIVWRGVRLCGRRRACSAAPRRCIARIAVRAGPRADVTCRCVQKPLRPADQRAVSCRQHVIGRQIEPKPPPARALPSTSRGRRRRGAGAARLRSGAAGACLRAAVG